MGDDFQSEDFFDIEEDDDQQLEWRRIVKQDLQEDLERAMGEMKGVREGTKGRASGLNADIAFVSRRNEKEITRG